MTSTTQPVIEAGDDGSSVEAALARVEAMVADGDSLAAIGWLAEQNRRLGDPRLEERLVSVRHRAFAALAQEPGRPDWPPPVPDRFGADQGLVEIAAADLTPEAVAAGIIGHGALLVRGLITDAEVATLVDAIDRGFAAADARAAGTPLADTATWYRPFSSTEGYAMTLGERGWVRDGGGLWTADSPRAFWQFTEIMTRAGVGELLEAYLGERPALSVNKATLRRVPVETGGEWHQDGAFLGDEIRTVNVWLSLTHCGDVAPGLDVVARRIPEILATGVDGAMFDWSVGPDAVERVKGPVGVLRPIFEAGDALLFDQRFLHRTAADPTMTEPRYAIESWFFAPSHYPQDQVPVVF
jgi:hypothetical protein